MEEPGSTKLPPFKSVKKSITTYEKKSNLVYKEIDDWPTFLRQVLLKKVSKSLL